MKPTVALLVKQPFRSKIIPEYEIKRLEEFANVRYEDFDEVTPEIAKKMIKDADACMTCWQTTKLTGDILDEAPNLKIIAHAAGSIKAVTSDDVWKRGIKVTNAVMANAISVAEHTLGVMIFMLKRIYQFNEIVKSGGWHNQDEIDKSRALYRINIGIIGGGHIGRHVIKLLQNFDVNVLLYDPYISSDDVKKMGATKVEDLSDLMAQSDLVSLHVPNLPSLKHMINKDNLKLLKDNAVFINTARGALVDEDALINELKTGRITAYLDVTYPEPPALDSAFRNLPNLIITPHIAGSISNDLPRMGNYVISELIRYFKDEPLLYEVKAKDVSRIA